MGPRCRRAKFHRSQTQWWMRSRRGRRARSIRSIRSVLGLHPRQSSRRCEATVRSGLVYVGRSGIETGQLDWQARASFRQLAVEVI